MSAAFGTQAFQQSRHARRIYVGGFPPNYGDEEALKFFLNSVIAKGLGEPNDNSYVLSIYVNQKKCFAFVELRAIELATACLDLDGIIYKKVVLKVLRANEYKPELIPPSMVGAPITLDLSSFSFGIPTATSNDKINVPSAQSSLTGATTHPSASSSSENVPDARLDSVIQFASLSYISSGCISIIGYPFDDRAAPNHNNNSSSAKDATSNGSNGVTPGGASNGNHLTSHSSNTTAAASLPVATTGSGSGGYTGLGCTQAPKKMRNMIRKYKFGLIQNPEYEVDLKKLKFIDVGDVQAGKTRDETKANLSAIVSEVVQRRAVPFVVGGSSDCAYYTAQGAMAASTRRVGMVVLSAQLDDSRILEDARMSGRGLSSHTAGIALPAAPGLGLVRETSSQSHNTSLPSESQHSALVKSELDSPPGMEKALNCGGRYIRFAAQGLLCSTQQAEYVTSKGGHIVWLGRDIRNQSAQCSVCATANGDNFAPLAGRTVPHVYTLALFREALRCAAGVKDMELAQARAAAEKKEEEEHALPAIYRVESQDPFCRDSADPSAEPPADAAAASEEEGPSSPLASPVSTPHGPGGNASEEKEDSLLGGVVVSIDMGVLTGAVRGCGYITGSSSSATGLTIDEILDIVMIAGADPNVLSLDISEFSPDAEDSRSSMLLAQMFYQFSLGVASRPAHASSAAKCLGLGPGRVTPAVTSMDVDASAGGSFMYGETAAVMRVPFRLTVDRSSELIQSRDLGSLSKTPKFYQEVSSGSMEAFTGTGAGPQSERGERGAEHAGGLPYVEVDHRLSSMDSLDMSAMTESGNVHVGYSKSGSTASSANISLSGKQQASPSHFVASPPSVPGSTSLSSSSNDSFQKQLYPTGIPPQYVAHSQSQRAALQAADVAGMFGGMIRTSPAGTPTTTMRRLNSASASSPPMGNRVMNPQKSASAGMLGVGGLYPNPVALPRGSSSHLSQQQQQQQLFAQQALHQQQQQQQALYAQQRPGAQLPQYSRPPAAAPYGSASASVPQGYPQQPQRSRYEQEQTWSGDRADPSQGRYVQHSATQRQQLLHQQHQQQQLFRLQQQQQAQQAAQSPLDDRSVSPQYLSPDFLDLGGDRMSNAGSSNNSYIGGLQGNARSSTNSTSSELSSALAGLGVGVSGSSDMSHSGPNSASDKSRGAIGGRGPSNMSTNNLNELHGSFDETMDMYEYRLAQQQQQQPPRRPVQGPSAQPSGGYLQPSSQQNPGSLQRGSGANQTYTQSNSMYSLYNSSASGNTSFSTAEALSFASGSGSTLNQDLMSSLSSGGSASVLFLNNNGAAPHGGHASHAAPSQGHLPSPAPRNSDLDAPPDFMSEHYSQYS